MASDGARIIKWQEDFRNGPSVYTVATYIDGQFEPGNLYESAEAAEVEMRWHRKRGQEKRYKVEKYQVHTLELAERRWGKADGE